MRRFLLLLIVLCSAGCSRYADSPADDAKLAAAKTKCRAEANQVISAALVFPQARGLSAFDDCLKREGY